jgi:NitT/TauT family transport system substrate-binding protein
MENPMKNPATLLALAVTALALTGCAGPGAGAATTEITVGVLPSVESAPLFLGIEEGYFAEEGLTLRVASFAPGSAALVAPVIKGDYDVAVSDLLTLMVAHDIDQPVQLIAPAGSATGDSAADFGALVVPDDSPIHELADLQGALVGSNSLRDTNHIVLRSTMDASVSASATIEWAEVPFHDAQASLGAGTVDAAFLVEPYLTRAINGGNRVVSHSYSEFDPALDVNAYFTSTTFATEHPELLERFTAALTRSIDHAAEKPGDARSAMSSYTQTQWNERASAVMPRYTAVFDADAAHKLAESGVKYALLKTDPAVDGLLP